MSTEKEKYLIINFTNREDSHSIPDNEVDIRVENFYKAYNVSSRNIRYNVNTQNVVKAFIKAVNDGIIKPSEIKFEILGAELPMDVVNSILD